MTSPLTISFNVHIGDRTEVITSEDLKGYAEAFRLDHYAADRYSWLFVLNLLSYERIYGINPFQIVDEIRTLEDSSMVTRTKLASQFTRDPLKGLWHKHFFCARFMAHNMRNHLSGGKLEKLVNEVLDPSKSPVITEGMIRELSHRVDGNSIVRMQLRQLQPFSKQIKLGEISLILHSYIMDMPQMLRDAEATYTSVTDAAAN